MQSKNKTQLHENISTTSLVGPSSPSHDTSTYLHSTLQIHNKHSLTLSRPNPKIKSDSTQVFRRPHRSTHLPPRTTHRPTYTPSCNFLTKLTWPRTRAIQKWNSVPRKNFDYFSGGPILHTTRHIDVFALYPANSQQTLSDLIETESQNKIRLHASISTTSPPNPPPTPHNPPTHMHTVL